MTIKKIALTLLSIVGVVVCAGFLVWGIKLRQAAQAPLDIHQVADAYLAFAEAQGLNLERVPPQYAPPSQLLIPPDQIIFGLLTT